MKYIAIAIILFFCFSQSIFAACGGSSPNLTAADTSLAEVQACVDASVDGDTITIPEGSSTWASALTWANKNITVIGQGTSTVITAHSAFAITATTKAAFRLSSFKLITDGDSGVVSITNTSQTPRGGAYGDGFRIDNLTIETSANGRTFMVYGLVYGVLSKITWTSSTSHDQFLTHYGYTNDGSEDGVSPFNQGTVAWSKNHVSGDANAIYVEGSTITCSETGGWAADVWYGGEVEFRYNTITRCQVSTHSARDTARGGKRINAYNNVFVSTGMTDKRVIWWRSGFGLVYNNSFDATALIAIDNQRTSCVWNSRCNGTDTTYDGNTAGESGWPCLDQPGRAYGAPQSQGSAPIFAWGNGDAVIAVGADISNVSPVCTTDAPHMADHLKTYGAAHSTGFFDYYNASDFTDATTKGLVWNNPISCPHPLTGLAGSCTTTAGTSGYNVETAYTMTPSSGTGYAFSPSSAQTVSSGSTQSFSLTCSYGYKCSVSGCGGTPATQTGVGTISYTTAAASESCSITGVAAKTQMEGIGTGSGSLTVGGTGTMTLGN